MSGTRTPAASAAPPSPKPFRGPGSRLTFLFDPGDGWLFPVEALEFSEATPRRRYPRILAAWGEAPPQYPEEDAPSEDGEIVGVNTRTCERIALKPR